MCYSFCTLKVKLHVGELFFLTKENFHDLIFVLIGKAKNVLRAALEDVLHVHISHLRKILLKQFWLYKTLHSIKFKYVYTWTL